MGFVGSSSGRGSSPAAFLIAFSALRNRFQKHMNTPILHSYANVSTCKQFYPCNRDELRCQRSVTKTVVLKPKKAFLTRFIDVTEMHMNKENYTS